MSWRREKGQVLRSLEVLGSQTGIPKGLKKIGNSEGGGTVAHRGKTQLNFSSETRQIFSRTQQSFREHHNLFENTTVFSRTQQSFREHGNLFENTTIFSRTQQSFREHNNHFENTTIISRTRQSFREHNCCICLMTISL